MMLTSGGSDEEIATSYDLGANGFVRKPGDFREFVRAARDLGAY
ncbi:MAG TPA: hypothetical protein VIL20_11430 [Sandaracinaceae bacterium]